MAFQSWVTMINADNYSGENKGSALKNSTTITDISPGANEAGKALTIPASYLSIGNIIRYTASGIYSVETGTKPTLKLALYYGGAAAGVVLAETIEITTVESATNLSWMMEGMSRVTEVGTTGKLITQANVAGIEAKSLTAASASTTMMPEETATGGESASIETGVAKTITLAAKWGTAKEANTIICYQWIVEILN
jgi:hypothetical protein